MHLTKSPSITAAFPGVPMVSAAACTLQFWLASFRGGGKWGAFRQSSREPVFGLAVLHAPRTGTSRRRRGHARGFDMALLIPGRASINAARGGATPPWGLPH